MSIPVCEARWYHGSSSVLRDGAALRFGGDGKMHNAGELILEEFGFIAVAMLAVCLILSQCAAPWLEKRGRSDLASMLRLLCGAVAIAMVVVACYRTFLTNG